MRAAPTSAPSAGKKSIWALAGICLLSIIGFLVAATIVLALIPVYISKKDLTPIKNNSTFYVEYSADADADTSKTGTVENLDEVAKSLGISDVVDFTTGVAQATFVRRKRHTYSGRVKRTLKTNFLFQCKPKKQPSCLTDVCLASFLSRIQQQIQKIGNKADIPCRIRSGLVSQTIRFSLTLVGFSVSLPIGYAGEVSSFTFVAIRSGAFNNPLTWSGGIVPYGEFSVVIPLGITVTLARSVFELKLKTCDVFGSLVLGSNSSSFTFNYPPNIIVHSGGILQDMTTNNRLIVPVLSLITLHPGGKLSGSGTILQVYTKTSGIIQLGSTVALALSGPFTCGVLPSGVPLSFNKVTFIAVQSGGFKAGSTYLGGLAPTNDICSLVGGCGLSIGPGVTLSTADLDGELNINIDEITVDSTAILSLGTSGSSSGFKFRYPLQLNIYGQLAYVSLGGGIYIPTASAINFYPGSRMTSTVSVFIQVYSTVTGANIGLRRILGLSVLGPMFFTISSTGTISISIVGPGGTEMPTTIGTSTQPVSTIIVG